MPQGLDNPYEIDEKGTAKTDFKTFSDRLRKAYPQQFGSFSDDQIAEAARKTPGFQLIDIPTTSTPPGITPQQFNTGMGKKQERPPTPSEIIIHGARWLPDVFSGAVGLATGGKTTPVGMAASGVAGMVGKGLERAIQYPFIQDGQLPPDISTETREIVEGYPKDAGDFAKDVALEGGKQAAFEGVGRGISAVLGGLYRSATHAPPPGVQPSRDISENIIAREASQKYDLGLTAPEMAGSTRRGTFGRAMQKLGDVSVFGMARTWRRQHNIAVKAADAFEGELYRLGPPTTEFSSGTALQETFTRAKKSFDDATEANYAEARQLGEASVVTVDMRPVKREAQRMLQENTELRGEFDAAAKMPREAEETLKGILSAGDFLPFNLVDKMRSRLGKKIPAASDKSFVNPNPKQREVGSTAKHMREYFFNALDSASNADPVLKEAWNKARTYHKNGQALFGETIVNSLKAGGTLPEKVVSSINPNEISNVRAAKEAVFRYAASVGDKQLADIAWAQYQQQFTRTWILGTTEHSVTDPKVIFKLGERLKKTNSEALSEIFFDPRGEDILTNLKSIGTALDRVEKTGGPSNSSLAFLLARAASFAFGQGYGLPPQAVLGYEAVSGLVSIVAHNKAATKFLTDGIGQLPKNTDAAISLILRAFDVANKTSQMPISVVGPVSGPVEDFGYGNFGPSVRTSPPPAGPAPAAPVKPSPIANPY